MAMYTLERCSLRHLPPNRVVIKVFFPPPDINLAAEPKVNRGKARVKQSDAQITGQYQNTLLHPLHSAHLLTWTVTFNRIIMTGCTVTQHVFLLLLLLGLWCPRNASRYQETPHEGANMASILRADSGDLPLNLES